MTEGTGSSSADQAEENTVGSTHPEIIEAPTSIGGILKKLGPGLIIAGSIVGSGELIATTSTGAQAGFSLLWLIILGCVIKVYCQVELGRFTIATGQTTMSGLAQVPVGRFGKINVILVMWFIMFIAILFQLGGIVGGVGQALEISMPVTDAGREMNKFKRDEIQLQVKRGAWSNSRDGERPEGLEAEILDHDIAGLTQYVAISKASGATESVDDVEKLIEKLNLIKTSKDPVALRFREEVLPQQSMFALIAESQKEKDGDGGKPDDIVDQLIPDDTSESEAATMTAWLNDYRQLRLFVPPDEPYDAKIWSVILSLATIVMLVSGRYGLIESFSTALVGMFTLVTVVNVFALQSEPAWGASFSEIMAGLKFSLPQAAPDGVSPLKTALSTFGIIGVGAAELIAYPYWCMEKGYAKFTGPRDETEEWANRARGWIYVMKWDAWCSMIVYTFATIAFYILGACVLGRINLDPEGPDMIRSLGVMYEPVFGSVAEMLFLFGAFAVLYSTFFVANAGNARMFSDAVRTAGFIRDDEQSYRGLVRIMSGVLPALCAISFVAGFEPRAMVMLSGGLQAIMLPVVAGSAIYFRFFRSDQRLAPSKIWDMLLYCSFAGMLVVGLYKLYQLLGG
ncbi:MAG: transmembrane Mn(2+) transporter [Planctomycetaceae bacterium]|nr:transmembrane Mn(2+) transporter [Planctomycetaceae bacterium]